MVWLRWGPLGIFRKVKKTPKNCNRGSISILATGHDYSRQGTPARAGFLQRDLARKSIDPTNLFVLSNNTIEYKKCKIKYKLH